MDKHQKLLTEVDKLCVEASRETEEEKHRKADEKKEQGFERSCHEGHDTSEKAR